MGGRFLIFIMTAFLTVLWAVAFGYLGLMIQDPKEALSLLTIGGITFIGLVYWIRVLYQNRTFWLHATHLKSAIGALSPSIEAVTFDAQNKIIWSTHPNVYPTFKEFTRKFLNRAADSTVAARLKEMIDQRQRGELLFHGGGNGLKVDQKWHLFSLYPFEKKGFLVILRDVTPHFSSYYQLRHQFDQLQTFVDQAPFGLFYQSKQGILLGVNATLCQWLGRPREEMIGHPVGDFIQDEASCPGTVLLSPQSGASFRALLFTPEGETQTKNSPSLLCRLDQVGGLANTDLIQEHAYLEAAIPAALINRDGEITSCNPAFTTLLGEAPLRKKFYRVVVPSQQAEIEGRLKKLFDQQNLGESFEVRFEGDRLQTTAYPSRPISKKGGEEIMLQFIDISEQKRLQRQFIQSQKMQAVGQLAGGVAHDFNNLLTAMIGYCDLLLQRCLPNDPSYNDIVQIRQNANRAASLVRQLLAFSRQQTLQPKVINLTDTLGEISTLLRRLIGAGIELKMIHARDLWFIKADVGQLEQVIVNLVVNARDAMKSGGVLTLRTSNVHLPKQERQGHDIIPKGDYVAIEVMDTGVGISPEDLDYIFEPFFSTKEVGEGTGLGLSTVYGIIKQTAGFIQVDSQVGQGTTFKILLPRCLGSGNSEFQKSGQELQDLTGGGRILLVEDEDAVRTFSARALREKGYTVIEANNGEIALDMVKNGEQFDVLITDVVMPKLDGPSLNKKIRDIRPNTKTIFISGYTEDTFCQNLDSEAHIYFLPKPYTLKELASKVKEVLSIYPT
jgi:two-component system, cell cycle sensor histidine kinase and response regulator CckA